MLCASVLGFEFVVLGLATIVLITIEDVDVPAAFGLGLGLAVLSLVIAGLLRFEPVYYAGFVLQAAVVALGVVAPAMFILGAAFAALWTTAYLVGRKIEREQAAYAEMAGR
jgi:hypothetical protein